MLVLNHFVCSQYLGKRVEWHSFGCRDFQTFSTVFIRCLGAFNETHTHIHEIFEKFFTDFISNESHSKLICESNYLSVNWTLFENWNQAALVCAYTNAKFFKFRNTGFWHFQMIFEIVLDLFAQDLYNAWRTKYDTNPTRNANAKANDEKIEEEYFLFFVLCLSLRTISSSSSLDVLWVYKCVLLNWNEFKIWLWLCLFSMKLAYDIFDASNTPFAMFPNAYSAGKENKN